MRIVYVCSDPGIPVFGTKGASVHVQEIVRAYVRLGHEVTLLAARIGGGAPDDLVDVEVVATGFDEVHDAEQRERAACAADRLVEHRILELPDVDLIHERYSLWGGGGMRASAWRHRPGVLEVNAPLIDEHAAHRVLVHDTLAHDRLRTTARAATAIVAVSDPVARWVADRIGSDAAPVEVVTNGVDVDRIRPASRGDGPFTVGFVGTIRPWHGVEVLARALVDARRSLPELRFLLVGDGPSAPDAVELARRGGVEVEHTGTVAPSAIPDLLTRMDVACAPYPTGGDTAYFSPLKVFEYLAAGLPVVASDVGQLPQLLDHGRAGVLVPPGDTAALTHAVVGLADDPDRRAQLGRRARERAVEHHSWASVARRTLQLTVPTSPLVGANR